MSFASLAICTNAARSCAHVLEGGMTRGIRASPVMIVRQMVLASLSSLILYGYRRALLLLGLIISLNLWGSKRSGLIRDPAKEIKDLQTCFNVLKESEKRCCSLDLMRPQCLLIAAASNAGGIRLAELGKLIFMLTKRYDINKISDMLNEASFLVNDYQITQNKRRRDSSQTLRQPMAPEYSQNNRSFPNPSMPAFHQTSISRLQMRLWVPVIGTPCFCKWDIYNQPSAHHFCLLSTKAITTVFLVSYCPCNKIPFWFRKIQ